MSALTAKLVLLASAVMGVESVPQVTISPETTYITKPLAADGYPDYVIALNQRYSEGVAPGNNAAVLYWKALGPEGINPSHRKLYCEMLGIEPLSEQGDYLVPLSKFVEARLGRLGESSLSEHVDEFREQLDAARHQPWSADDYPMLAAWLEANEEPLQRALEGTRRTECYAPLISWREPPRVHEVLLPLVDGSYWLARAFTARALLRLEAGKVDAAWEDILACFWLSRHIGQQPYLVHAAVAMRFNSLACEATQALARHGRLSAEQLGACRRDLAALPPLPDIASKMDVAERFAMLDTLLRVLMQGGPIPEDMGPLDLVRLTWMRYKIATSFDWDEILRAENDYLDRIVAQLKKTEYRQRKKGLQEVLEPAVKASEEFPVAIRSEHAILGFQTMEGSLGRARLQLLAIARSEGDRRTRTRIAADLLAGYISAAPVEEEARARVQMDLTRLALALAGHQAEHGEYPEELAELVPGQLNQLPLDEFTGNDFRYQRQEGSYRLYSVGPDGVDDGGQEDDIAVARWE